MLLGTYGLLPRAAGILGLLYALVFSWAYYQGTFLDLLPLEAQVTGVTAGARAVASHHAFLRCPPIAGLVVEWVLLAALYGLSVSSLIRSRKPRPNSPSKN